METLLLLALPPQAQAGQTVTVAGQWIVGRRYWEAQPRTRLPGEPVEAGLVWAPGRPTVRATTAGDTGRQGSSASSQAVVLPEYVTDALTSTECLFQTREGFLLVIQKLLPLCLEARYESLRSVDLRVFDGDFSPCPHIFPELVYTLCPYGFELSLFALWRLRYVEFDQLGANHKVEDANVPGPVGFGVLTDVAGAGIQVETITAAAELLFTPEHGVPTLQRLFRGDDWFAAENLGNVSVPGRRHHVGDRRVSVSPTTADLLVVPVDCLGQACVKHSSHVRQVYAQTEC
jgi:hypothetical protein